MSSGKDGSSAMEVISLFGYSAASLPGAERCLAFSVNKVHHLAWCALNRSGGLLASVRVIWKSATMDAGKISLEQLSSSQGERLSTGGNPSPNVSKSGRSPSPAFNLTQSGKTETQTLLQVQQLSVPPPSQPLSQFVKRSPSPAVGLFQSTSSGRSPSPSITSAAYSSPSSASLAHGNQSSTASSGPSTSDGPPPPKRKRLFHRELKYMMHGFGDDPNPYSETVDLVEELVVQFITEMTVKAMEVGKSGRVHVNDIIFIIRKDPKKYSRVKDLLMMKEQIDKAKKAFSDDSEPLEL